MYNKFKADKAVQIDYLYTFFKLNVEKGFVFDGEFHNFYEIVCCIEGSVGITSDSEAFVISQGQAIIHSPMEFHKIRSIGMSAKVIIFSFSGTVAGDNFGRVFAFDDEILDRIFSLGTEIFEFGKNHCVKEIRDGKQFDALLFINRLECLVVEMIAAIPLSVEQLMHSKRYRTIIRILEDNTDKCMSLEEIAVQGNMSVSLLKKIFSKYSGMGVIRYFNELKMKKAISFLRLGMSVKETAFKLGFSDVNYFSYTFKKIIGEPPSKFKG